MSDFFIFKKPFPAGVYGLAYDFDILSHVIERLDNGRNCTIIWSTNLSFFDRLDSNPLVLAEPKETSDFSQMVNFLRTEVFCVITVVQWQQNSSIALASLMTSTKVIGNHKTIYLSQEEPPPTLMVTAIKRPLIWIKEVGYSGNKSIDVFCPKMGKPPQPERKIMVPFSGKFYNANSRKPEDIEGACRNPMRGQLITLAALPARPQIHFPNTVGNKKMSGIVVNLFFTYAKIYKFKTKMTFGGGGSYIPQNKSFTPGQYNSVNNDTNRIS